MSDPLRRVAEQDAEPLPVRAARASTVFCEPFLASTGQAKPTHCRQRAQAARPSYGHELMASGTGTVATSPSCRRPASNKRVRAR